MQVYGYILLSIPIVYIICVNNTVYILCIALVSLRKSDTYVMERSLGACEKINKENDNYSYFLLCYE